MSEAGRSQIGSKDLELARLHGAFMSTTSRKAAVAELEASRGRRWVLDLRTAVAQPVTIGRTEPTGVAALLHLAQYLRDPDRASASLRDAPLTLSVGELAGTGVPAADRAALIGISPASGRVAEAYGNGPLAAAVRRAGLDLLSLVGAASEPVYLTVSAGEVHVRSAAGLWGLDTRAATQLLRERHGHGATVAVVGVAGERALPGAAVVVDGEFALAKYGLGGRWGGKRLKALVVVPASPQPPYDAEAARAIATDYGRELHRNPLTSKQHAPPGFVRGVGADAAPGQRVRDNFRDTSSGGPALLGPPIDNLLVRSTGGCPGCPTDCLKSFAAGDGQVALVQEWLPSLGPHIGDRSLSEALASVRHCLDLGLDPATAGCTIAAARELGFDRATGDLIDAIAGEPVEDVPIVLREALQRGPEAVARHLGRPEVAMTVDGLALPPLDPRPQAGLALALAVAPSGPRVDICEHDFDFDPDRGMPHAAAEAARLGLGEYAPASRIDHERVTRTAVLMRLWSGLDALGVCLYACTPTRPLGLEQVCELVRAASGREIGPVQVLAIGQRRFQLQGEVNRLLGRAGWARRLPARFHDEPVAAGRSAGAVLDRDRFAWAADQLAAELGLVSADAEQADSPG